MHTESYFIPMNSIDKLHLKRMYENPAGTPVFLLHGAVENGRIFFSKSGKGLAPYLASQGFDVYIGDLRGRGLSTPAINAHSTYGQTESITEEIPAFIEQIIRIRGNCKQHWIAHSWGGVLLSSYFARFATHRHLVSSMVYLAAKRHVGVWNLRRFYYIDFCWGFLAPILTAIVGYLPATKLRMGADNETKKSQAQSVRWVAAKNWVDDDGFDYGAAIKHILLPPILYMTGLHDYALGNLQDVQDFMLESHANNTKFLLLAKNNGNLHDYDHIDIMTSPDADRDHFPIILEWLNQHE